MVAIYAEDTEEVRASKRRANEKIMAEDHKRGALLLPLGIPKECKIDQKETRPTPTYKQRPLYLGTGLTKNVYFDGHQHKYYAWGFSGMARANNEGFDGEF